MRPQSMLSPALNTHRLTPQMAGSLSRIQRAKRPPLHTLTPAQACSAYEAGRALDAAAAAIKQVVTP